MNTRPGDPLIPMGPGPGPAYGPGPTGAGDPSQRMLTEIAELRVKATGRDLLLLRLGVVLMVAGPAVTVIGYLLSSQAKDAAFQRDAIVVALVGVAISVVGATLFLRYSLGEFLRFWMARILAEQARTSAPVQPAVAPRREPVAPTPAPNPNQHMHLPNGRMAPAPAPSPTPPPPPSSSPYGPMTDRRPER
jgi:hypothetical protein